MDELPWKVHQRDLEAGDYGWSIDRIGTLPEGLKPRTLLKVIDPHVRGDNGSILIEVRDRRGRQWVMSPMFFEPVLIYEDSVGNRYPEFHPRAMAMLQRHIRRLEQKIEELHAEIDNVTWRSTRRSPARKNSGSS
jgi:hypothetical protein